MAEQATDPNQTQPRHGPEWIKVLRSALFLASLVVILEYHHVLIWVDAFMLSIVPRLVSHIPGPGPAQALVFTIEEGLFETKFKSRSPIDREVLKKYLENLVHHFPQVKVLAIDYDLSPNNYVLSSYTEKGECKFADPAEENAQKVLDDFLIALHKERPKDKKIQVVLIKHIPVRNPALCECKLRWQQEKRNQGIMFGHPNLIHLGEFGPIIKYSEYTIYKDSFPAVILAAKKDEKSCNYLDEMAYKNLSYASFQSINYLKNYKNSTVKPCSLDEVNEFTQCKENWSKLGVNIAEANVVFFGGAYGKDDIYITPLGPLPGVIIQAHVYASMSEYGLVAPELVWLFDIVLGFLVGMGFHRIWSNFHKSKKNIAPQVIWATLNFTILIFVLISLAFMAAHLLPLGLWINPAVVVFGLFIHSYVAAVTPADNPLSTSTGGGVTAPADNPPSTSTGGGVTAPADNPPPTSTMLALSLLFGIPSPIPEKWELIFHGTLKIAAFWITIGLAVYMLITHH